MTDRAVRQCSECFGQNDLPLKFCSAECKDSAAKRYQAQRELVALAELNRRLEREANEYR
jgi:hypothetical protein